MPKDRKPQAGDTEAHASVPLSRRGSQAATVALATGAHHDFGLWTLECSFAVSLIHTNFLSTWTLLGNSLESASNNNPDKLRWSGPQRQVDAGGEA